MHGPLIDFAGARILLYCLFAAAIHLTTPPASNDDWRLSANAADSLTYLLKELLTYLMKCMGPVSSNARAEP